MPAQAEYHTQVQATYDYFGHHHRIQQESHKEALQVVRDYHHQALTAAAMLEGHIEWLSCSISWAQYGNWSRRQSGSQEAGDTPEVTVIPGATEDICWPAQEQTLSAEGCPGDAARRQMDSPSPV